MTYVTFAVWIPGCNLGLKWCICSFEWCTSGTSGKVVLRVSEVDKESVAEGSKRRRGYADVQGAARFPIKLPVALKSGGPGGRGRVCGAGQQDRHHRAHRLHEAGV